MYFPEKRDKTVQVRFTLAARGIDKKMYAL
jgi:hypothetical protein